IRHMNKVCLGRLLEELDRKMLRGVHARRAAGKAVRLLPGAIDQLLQRSNAGVRIGNKHQRDINELCDWSEFAQRFEARARIGNMWIDNERPRLPNSNCMTV